MSGEKCIERGERVGSGERREDSGTVNLMCL
jgi:hypothetical protein